MDSSADSPILDIESLAFSFRDTTVLREINLSVGAGRVLALLGPNGAGKSTLIRCICGRLNADAGTVRVGGRDPGTDAGARADIGLVPQQVALYPHLTVRENLAAFARLAGVARGDADEAVRRTLEVCDLESVAERPAGRLSGGWQRRANIGCALAHLPSLLVLDEPTVGIDPPARRGIERLLQRLGRTGIAILMTSHDLSQLEGLADEVAFLSAGRIAATGTPGGLIREFFGERRECLVLLDATPRDAVARVLKAAGLKAADTERVHWQGLIDEERAWTLRDELPETDCVRELSIRRPGLDTLWIRLYGTAPERAA